MNERRPGFAPRLMRKEIMSIAPAGMEVTRVDGKLYVVPEKGNDPYYGKSAYTERQIEAISKLHSNPEKGLIKSGGAW